MGMRQDLTNVGPQSLESPIPGMNLDEDTIGQILQLSQPVKETAQPTATAEVEPEVASAPRLPASAEEDEFAALEREEEKEFAALESLDNPQVEAVKNILEERGFMQTFIDRWKAGIPLQPGGDKKRAMQAIRKRMPDAKVTLDKKNNILVNGKRFDPEEWELADFADWSGDFIEAILSTSTEASIAIPAMASGVPVAGIGGIATAAAVYPIAAAAGASAGILGREKWMVENGIEPLSEAERISMIKIATGYNLAGLGIGAIGKGVIRAGKWAISGIIESWPKNIIKQLAVIHKSVDDVARKFGVPDDPKVAGEKVISVVENLNKSVGAEVGLLKRELIETSKGKQFIPEDYLKGAREFFEDQRIQFNEKGVAEYVPGVSKKLGSGDQGVIALKKMAKQYNEISEKVQVGKFDIDILFDEAKTAAKGVDWDIPPGATRGELNYHFEELSKLLTSDKNKAAVAAAKGTKYEGTVMNTMEAFSSKVDDLNQIIKLSRNKESQELLMKALVNKENSTRLQKLQRLLGGENSKHWKDFRASWIAREIEKSVDPDTGIFLAETFLKRVSDMELGNITRKLMISDIDYNKIRAASASFKKIGISNVLGKNEEEITKLAISLMSPFRAARARAVAILLKGKANASDYLVDRGFVELAEKAATTAEKMDFLQAKHWLSKVLLNSKQVWDKKGRKIYIHTPISRNILQRGWRTGIEEAQGTVRAIDENYGVKE